MIESLSFGAPWAFVLLLLFPLAWWRRRRSEGLRYSRGRTAAAAGRRVGRLRAVLPYLFRGLALLCLIIALARPRTGISSVEFEADGIAIAVVVDISSSMLALDMEPLDRLEVAKKTVSDFVEGRQYDRIGLVAFAGEALTQVPVTIDYTVLQGAIERLEVGMLEDGTAIGTALATATNRLRRTPGESKVIILLTDGENNRGEVDPITAARAAATFGVKSYTIGVGREGVAPVPIGRGPFGTEYANMPVRIDEGLLRRIAEITGGRYFRATNAEALAGIYEQIDELERTPVSVTQYVDFAERYRPFVLLCAALLIAEWGLRARRYPLYV